MTVTNAATAAVEADTGVAIYGDQDTLLSPPHRGTDQNASVDFATSIHRGSGELAVTVSGELDVETAPRLLNVLLDGLNTGQTSTVVVDLSAVRFMDAAAINVLAKALRYARLRSLKLILSNPSAAAQRMLRWSGVDRQFPTMYDI